MQYMQLLPHPRAMSIRKSQMPYFQKKGHIYKNCPRNGQFSGQQSQNSLLSNLMIEIIQTNIAVVRTKEFLVIEEALTLDIFLRIIYITVPKLIAAMSIIA